MHSNNLSTFLDKSPFTAIAMIVSAIAHKDSAEKALRSTEQISQAQRELLEKENTLAREQQLKLAYLTIVNQEKIEHEKQGFQLELERDRQRFHQRLESLRLGQQLSLEAAREEFQLRLSELNYEHQERINLFVKGVDAAIHRQNLNFQRWRSERDIALQKELAAYNRNTQIIVAKMHRENVLLTQEANQIYQNWPLMITPSQILGTGANSLKVIICPPERTPQQPKTQANKQLEYKITQILSKHYSTTDPQRPVVFFDNVWNKSSFRGAPAIKALFDMLKSEPTLILETDDNENGYSLRVAYWGPGATDFSSDCFYQWLIPEIKVDKWESFLEHFIQTHLLIISFFVDSYYLVRKGTTPSLPSLLPLILDGESTKPSMELIQYIVDAYKTLCDGVNRERPYWAPDLVLQLSDSLLTLSDKSWSQSTLTQSIVMWLEQRGIYVSDSSTLDENLVAMNEVVTPSDQEYLLHLRSTYEQLLKQES